MGDYLLRAVEKDQQFRVFAAVTTELVEEARRRHDTWPIATAALGRTLTGGLLMGANLKGDDDTLTIRILGDGPLGAILVSANARGEVRGYVQEPHVDLPRAIEGKLPVGAAVGKGMFHATRDLGLKEPFTGSVELVSGEIAEDFAFYLTKSEQTPSAVSLGVLVAPDGHVEASGGLWLQLFPGADETIISRLEENIQRLLPVSTLIHEGQSPEDIIKLVTGGLDVKLLERTPVRFACRCTRERVEEMLISLGPDEIRGIVEDQGKADVRCHFCGEEYVFGENDLNRLLQEIK